METENEAVAAEVVDEDPGDRYFQRLAPILQEADDRNEIGPLVDKMTDALAYIAVRYHEAATGDMLKRFGGHILERVGVRDTGWEAGAARSVGRKPH